MAINLNLNPRRDLLNCNFEGYKLKPFDDQIVHSRNVEGGIFRNDTEDVTCYLYTKMESLHNHLFFDTFEENIVFYYNSKGHVVVHSFRDARAILSSQCSVLCHGVSRASFVVGDSGKNGTRKKHCVQTPFVVWQEEMSVINDEALAQKHLYSPTLSFPSPNLALSCNGRGLLSILLTGDRLVAESWLSLKSEVIPSSKLVHSLVIEAATGAKPKQELHVLLLAVSSYAELQKDRLNTNLAQFKDQKSSLHVLYWLTFEFDGSNWSLCRERRVVGSNSLDYVSLDETCQGVVLLCHSHYAFVYDSVTPVNDVGLKSNTEKKSSPQKYLFQQNNEEIKLWVNPGGDIVKEDLKIQVENQNLKIWVKEKLLLDKQFLNTVDNSASTWTIESNKVEICIPKSKENVRWTRIFEEDDVEGEEILDDSQLEEIHQRLLHLTSEEWNPNPEPDNPAFNPGQLEACDDATEDMSLLVLDGTTHLVSHLGHLGTVQHLFNVTEKGSAIPKFCLRYDVDGLVWGHNKDHVFEHSATFNAFGYVKASKTLAKFTAAARDCSYVAIADVNSHVYVFCQSDTFGGELKNRVSGKVSTSVARQLVISLKNHDQVMGFHVDPKALFVLTDSNIFVYEL